jgi:hypothetical protein
VRWDGSGTAATELGHLGVDDFDDTFSVANAVNDAGTAVGFASLYDAAGNAGGNRAVRWDASGTAATELGHLGTRADGTTLSNAYAINNAGTVVGYAAVYDGLGNSLGDRAVRWNTSSVAASQLGHLGTQKDGITNSYAYTINDAGTAVGYAAKYDSAGKGLGERAVRWDDEGAVATELGDLGTNISGVAFSRAYAINSMSDVVGYAEKYDAEGNNDGVRAVRWDISGAIATELGNLGTTATGFTISRAYDINDAGISVGVAVNYDPSILADVAVMWGPNNEAVDLNTLIAPDSGWRLLEARHISDTGWISGIGRFDLGGEPPYERLFLLQVRVVPEPASIAIACVSMPSSLLIAHLRRGSKLA